MDGFRRKRDPVTHPESGIVLIGLSLTVIGFIFQNTILGITFGYGIGLTVAGSVYITLEGPKLVRLTVAFVALVAFQLILFGGVMRRIGVAMTGIVVVSILYTRVSK